VRFPSTRRTGTAGKVKLVLVNQQSRWLSDGGNHRVGLLFEHKVSDGRWSGSHRKLANVSSSVQTVPSAQPLGRDVILSVRQCRQVGSFLNGGGVGSYRAFSIPENGYSEVHRVSGTPAFESFMQPQPQPRRVEYLNRDMTMNAR
jgi:hypothetical protein